MSNKDLMSRDYDVRQIEEDPRFKQCHREFWVLAIIIGITLAAIMIVSYAIDWGPVSEYTYILGIPTWAAISTVISIVGTIACFVYIAFFVKDVPLDDIPSSEKEDETV